MKCGRCCGSATIYLLQLTVELPAALTSSHPSLAAAHVPGERAQVLLFPRAHAERWAKGFPVHSILPFAESAGLDNSDSQAAVEVELTPEAGNVDDSVIAALPSWQELSLAARIAAVLNRRSDVVERFGERVVKSAVLGDDSGADEEEEEEEEEHEISLQDVEAAVASSPVCLGMSVRPSV